VGDTKAAAATAAQVEAAAAQVGEGASRALEGEVAQVSHAQDDVNRRLRELGGAMDAVSRQVETDVAASYRALQQELQAATASVQVCVCVRTT
jgi:hypothetical protein